MLKKIGRTLGPAEALGVHPGSQRDSGPAPKKSCEHPDVKSIAEARTKSEGHLEQSSHSETKDSGE